MFLSVISCSQKYSKTEDTSLERAHEDLKNRVDYLRKQGDVSEFPNHSKLIVPFNMYFVLSWCFFSELRWQRTCYWRCCVEWWWCMEGCSWHSEPWPWPGAWKTSRFFSSNKLQVWVCLLYWRIAISFYPWCWNREVELQSLDISI